MTRILAKSPITFLVLAVIICTPALANDFQEPFSLPPGKALFINGQEFRQGVLRWDSAEKRIYIDDILIYPHQRQGVDQAYNSHMKMLLDALHEDSDVSCRNANADTVEVHFLAARNAFHEVVARMATGKLNKEEALGVVDSLLGNAQWKYLVKTARVKNARIWVFFKGIGWWPFSPPIDMGPYCNFKEPPAFDPLNLANILRKWFASPRNPEVLVISGVNSCSTIGLPAVPLLKALRSHDRKAIAEMLTEGFARDF
jgi:hypothetical protein